MANGCALPSAASAESMSRVQSEAVQPLQPFPFLCLKPCFPPAPFFLKPDLALWPLDLKDLSFLFRSNFFPLPNFFSPPPALGPKVFPPGFVFFPNGFSPSLEFFHPFPFLFLSCPPGLLLLGDLAALSFLGGLPGDRPFLFLALGNMSAQKRGWSVTHCQTGANG